MAEFTKEEQIQAIYNLKVGYTLGHADIAILKAVSRQLLAWLGQEPVAYMHHSGQVVTRGECCDDEIFAICCKVETPLYAAPQLPQPAVVDIATVETTYPDVQTNWQDAKMYAEGWNACRATMFKQPSSIQASDGTASGAEIKQPASNGQSFGNSEQLEPVSQPYTLRDGLAAIRNSGIAIDAEKIQAERDALNEPTCWCLACRPVTMNDPRFVVCPECGNKRCPHANDHRNACTGSNEPGQEGSAYPTAPQQEANNG